MNTQSTAEEGESPWEQRGKSPNTPIAMIVSGLTRCRYSSLLGRVVQDFQLQVPRGSCGTSTSLPLINSSRRLPLSAWSCWVIQSPDSEVDRCRGLEPHLRLTFVRCSFSIFPEKPPAVSRYFLSLRVLKYSRTSKVEHTISSELETILFKQIIIHYMKKKSLHHKTFINCTVFVMVLLFGFLKKTNKKTWWAFRP